ncbi:band 4.1-like protein 1 isoform X15 [Prionailurus iriomotensis]
MISSLLLMTLLLQAALAQPIWPQYRLLRLHTYSCWDEALDIYRKGVQTQSGCRLNGKTARGKLHDLWHLLGSDRRLSDQGKDCVTSTQLAVQNLLKEVARWPSEVSDAGPVV